MARTELWVVKAGSSAILEGGPPLIRAWMKQVAELRRSRRIRVVWVTSGAIASARQRMRLDGIRLSGRGSASLAEKQALSAIGQPGLMDAYRVALGAVGLVGAQVLLTADDLAHRKRLGNFRKTVGQLLKWGVVPVLNENDAVATEEIQFGDNDGLSARVAVALGADRLVILTDVDGLHEKDPRKDARSRVIRELAQVDARVMRLARGSPSRHGTGGMVSKLRAAAYAGHGGIDVWLVPGARADILKAVARDESVGTRVGSVKKVTTK